jgi:hypothetical protein
MLEQWVQFNTQKDYFWVIHKRKKQFDALPQSMKDIVIQFWTTQTIIFPNPKDVVKRWISIKVDEEHVPHYLQVSQVILMQLGPLLCTIDWKSF